MKSQVDLVIPTYNRPHLLRRILEYYHQNGKDFNFIIADSSNSVNKTLNKDIINSYSDLNILYIDKFPQTIKQHDKFIKMVNYVKSKYCVFCADDDFIIPRAINEAVKFLEKNPDYSAAHGTHIGYALFKNFRLNKFFWLFRQTPYSISSSDPIERVYQHLSNYSPVIWAVRRTDVVKTCYQEFGKIKFDPYVLPVFGELLPDMLTVVYGKVKDLNTFYAVRQYFGSILSFYPSLIDAKKVGKYDTEYSKFKSSLVNNLSGQKGVSKDRASKMLDRAIERYIKFSYQGHLMGNLSLILSKLPNFISVGLRGLNAVYLFSKPKKEKVGLIDNKSSKYFEDYNKIKQLVLKYNE
jgi:glycosyltransferase domain-containing protein